MDNLKYYMDEDTGSLLVYGSEFEFFMCYNKETKKWQDCILTFTAFKHDRYYRSVSLEEAFIITCGNMPDQLYTDYISWIKSIKS